MLDIADITGNGLEEGSSSESALASVANLHKPVSSYK